MQGTCRVTKLRVGPYLFMSIDTWREGVPVVEGLTITLHHDKDHYGLVMDPIREGDCVRRLMDAADAYGTPQVEIRRGEADAGRVPF